MLLVPKPEYRCIELWLPHPPSANALWVRSRQGMRKSDRYSEWLTEAAIESLKPSPTHPNGFRRRDMIAGPYKLTLTAARPDKRKRDLDNLIKPISDLLQFIGAIKDDCFCEMICARWATNGDGVAVRIEPAGIE